MTIRRANGYIKFHREDDEYIIDLVWVSVGARNKGVATHLIKLVEKYVSQRASCNTISFYAEPQDDITDKERLYNFYRNLGYEDNECEGLFYKTV